jgi:hypothetical protein
MSSEIRTELQQIASRTNGAKSRGPITEEGKQASSQNRLAHGFNSKRVVLPGESQEEFDELLASYLEEHQPETPTERTLIENMAIARWRQQRAWTLETAGLTNEMRRPRYIEGEEVEIQAFVAFRTLTDDSRALELLNRYETRSERQFRAALTAFQSLRAKRRAEERSNAPANQPAEPEGVKRVRLWWVDDEGNKTLQADTHPGRDPEPEPESLPETKPASGSFRNPENTAQNHCLHLVRSRPRHLKPALEPSRLTRIRAVR